MQSFVKARKTGGQMNQNIILIGFMGSGKTCVGEALAKRLLYRFQDTDQLIEQRAGCTINDIFEKYGEGYFRMMETNLLMEFQSSLERTVLSSGGGLPMREKNVQLLQSLGVIVYLKAAKNTLKNRLLTDNLRPLLKGEALDIRIEKMLSIREPIYESVSQLKVVTDKKNIDQVVNLIIDVLT
jgi:shikimate kinase